MGNPTEIRIMKTLLGSVLLSLLLIAAHAQAEQASPPEQRTFLVGFAQDTLDNDWRSAQVRELQGAFASHPEIHFIYTNAHGHTAQQIQDIEDLAAKGVDLLMTSPRDGRAMGPAISAIYRRGIPVVLLTRRIPGEDYTSFIAPDDRAIAARAADVLAKKLGGKGRILVLQGVPTATTAIQRTQGFTQRLKKYPGMEIAAMRVGNYLRADALNEMEKVLMEGIAFDAIYSQSDSMAAGARMALRGAGIDPKTIPLVGIDYIPESRDAIRSGEQLASFTYPTCAKEGVAQVMRILHGKPFKHDVMVESTLVTKENVEEVEPIF
jgi:ribose transport system substrate-binding protein